MFVTNVRIADREADMKSSYYRIDSYMEMYEVQKKNRLARARQVRRQKSLILIGVLITMAFISFFSIKAFADTGNTSDCFGTKQFKSVKIFCGDTVESIAEDNYCALYPSVGRYAQEIRTINHISAGEELIPGNYIVIPYFQTASGY